MGALFSEDFFSSALWTVFMLATSVQIAFAMLVWRAFSMKPKTAPAIELPAISVIICARNEAQNLRKNLPEILAQHYPSEWELLVVNDASEDETADILQEFQQKYARLRVLNILRKTSPGKKAALTQGIAEAKFEHLLLTDADCRPAGPDWMKCMAAAFAQSPETEIVLGYGPLEPVRKGFWSRWTQLEAVHTAMLYVTFCRMGMPYMGVGRNLAFKKSLFNRVNGYSSHQNILSGDDDLLVNAAANAHNTAVCLAPESFMYSPGKDNFQSWFHQKQRHLSSSPAYQIQHKWLLGFLALSHTLHFLLFLLFIISNFGVVYALIFGLARSTINYLVFLRVSYALHARALRSRFPIYDALLAVYYGAFVSIILIGKKTHSWT